jgi:hypothetical protein
VLQSVDAALRLNVPSWGEEEEEEKEKKEEEEKEEEKERPKSTEESEIGEAASVTALASKLHALKPLFLSWADCEPLLPSHARARA